MGLLRDWNYIESATRIPALSEMIREALIRALFVRNDRLLPREIIADLTREPTVTVKVKDDGEVRKLVGVLNGEESTLSLGLNAEDYNYFRTQLGVGKDREIGLTVRPRTLLTYAWLVPEQRGVQLDFGAYAGLDFDPRAHRVVAQVGATWKTMYDEAAGQGHAVPFVPTVPLDFSIGDSVWGDAPLGSYDGDLVSYVNGVRAVSAYGHRTRIGFEEVANDATGYDLLHATFPLLDEYCVPLAVAFRLEAKPAARKALAYTFDDPLKLAAALDRLSRTTQRLAWVHIADASAAAALRPGAAADAFVVQVALTGTASSLPIREKAVDASMAGFKTKVPDLATPYDVPPDAYRKNADRIAQAVFVGEVRLPASALGDFANRLQTFGQQAAAKPALYASLRRSGSISAFPAFDATKDRPHVYDLSKGIARLVDKVPGAVFTSRLAHLWSEEGGYRTRMDLLRQLKLAFDTAHVMEPLVVP